jgi:hypothetical protein
MAILATALRGFISLILTLATLIMLGTWDPKYNYTIELV